MIPKIIHYCWFGGSPMPALALQCIASWKKYLPDYEIKEWNESNFDVDMIPYTAEAYRKKKYAFVSDYARFWIMYHYGGIYFDTDVEVIRPMEEIVAKGNFMGFEVDPDGENSPRKYAPRYAFGINPGLGIGMEKGHPFTAQMLSFYTDLHFEECVKIEFYKTVVFYTTDKLIELGLEDRKGIQKVNDIFLYPHEYFAPIDVITRRLHITKNTYSIHRYMGSWDNEKRSLKDLIKSLLPEWVFYLNNRMKRKKYKLQ